MKIFYILLILIILYLGFFYVRFRSVLANAHLPVVKQDEKTLGHGPQLKYMAAGDSTAVGEGASRVEKTYTYQIANFLSQKNTVDYKNIAVIGSTTEDVIDHQLGQIIAADPDVVTISIGANDITHWVSADKILANYQKIIAALTTQTKAQVYITDIPGLQNAKLLPLPYRKYLDWRAKGLNTQLLKLETARVKFVDIHDFGWSQYPDIQLTFAADEFHPSDLGYENWTNAFLSRIKQ